MRRTSVATVQRLLLGSLPLGGGMGARLRTNGSGNVGVGVGVGVGVSEGTRGARRSEPRWMHSRRRAGIGGRRLAVGGGSWSAQLLHDSVATPIVSTHASRVATVAAAAAAAATTASYSSGSKAMSEKQSLIAEADLAAMLGDESSADEYEVADVADGVHTWRLGAPFDVQLGGTLPDLEIAYETWGTLNATKDNVVLLHTGLSSSSHAKSNPQNTNSGWWEQFIGDGGPIDTSKFFVICTNVLGGCYGSTGPSSLNPATGEVYALDFPVITVFDIVRAQFEMLTALGIDRLHASIGSSLGGMQSLAAAAMYPDRVGRMVSISACARTHPYSIALRFAQRRVIMSDPDWCGGNYIREGKFPALGMKMARELATVTYRSGPEWEQRFANLQSVAPVASPSASSSSSSSKKRGTNGKRRGSVAAPPSIVDPCFVIEEYLLHQGKYFAAGGYDPNSLLYIARAMDLFDMSLETPAVNDKWAVKGGLSRVQEGWALRAGMARVECPSLVIGVKSDVLFPVHLQKEVADLLKETGNDAVTYYELDSIYGHDTFLIDVNNVGGAIKGHLELH